MDILKSILNLCNSTNNVEEDNDLYDNIDYNIDVDEYFLIKGLLCDKYNPDNFNDISMGTISLRDIKSNEVEISIKASSLNQLDRKLTTGLLHQMFPLSKFP
jgi:hypothetical protein